MKSAGLFGPEKRDGIVVCSFAIRALMERDPVDTLDFGRGDDPYKRGWTTRRTLHIGVQSVRVARRPILVARHVLGAAARKLRGGQRTVK